MPLVTGRGTNTHPVSYVFSETQNANLHRKNHGALLDLPPRDPGGTEGQQYAHANSGGSDYLRGRADSGCQVADWDGPEVGVRAMGWEGAP